jgi:cation diffusion facilitator CzcD-associated flavoprotein CzcO
MTHGNWAQTGGQPRIAIIGAGMSGIAAVVKLRKAGYSDITVFEKAGEVGGTWRENKYPGLSCDVESHWYSFTFNPNPNWSHRFAYGPEIQDYMVATADKFDIRRITRFNQEVVDLTYEEPEWKLTTKQGSETFDVVISATGVLHKPAYPTIKGVKSFAGTCFHTARWDTNTDLRDKRVGIIGTGSTSAQIIGAITRNVKHMTVFQRTAQWIAPLPQRKYGAWEKALFRTFPFLLKLSYYWKYFMFRLVFAPATVGNKLLQKIISSICLKHLEKGVPDPALRQKLTPSYQALCKRLIFCSDFYPAISSVNATLVTEAIDKVTAKGVVTKDGVEHELDVLILATGFDSSAFILPTKVTGRNGTDLAAVWGRAPRAHRGVGLPDFPNFWMLEGPTSPIGNLSLIMISEHQVDYIISLLEEMRRLRLSYIVPSQKAYEDYNADMSQQIKKTIWVTGGCDSWYIDASGQPNLYAYPPTTYLKDMHKLDLAEFEFGPLSNRIAAE